jgi:hypothetical protein
MVEVAGAVADGLITHPFGTRRSLEELVRPALARGIASTGRKASDVEVVVVCMIATGATGADLDASIAAVRGQLAFYGSTPAYAPVLELEGHGELHARLNALSKQGRWADMDELVPDDLLESIAVVGRRDEIAPLVLERTAGIADAVSIECTRRPDPGHWADIVADLRARLGR